MIAEIKIHALLKKKNSTGRGSSRSARRCIERGRTKMRAINSSEWTSFGVELDELADVDAIVVVAC
ncbi:hypothetical protein RHGRI_001770 [Rhododendron griersonianum]|uniref:Uncharacterized protein n=1 Tax=Rhododendron griersonianum TaxID=479676 RepID=A0AAV6LLZ1_9ERIC|nr:hypothetical protein RHGRI_001770 [Rhododendron griersonianum]